VDIDRAISLKAVDSMRSVNWATHILVPPPYKSPILHLFDVSAALHTLPLMHNQNEKKLFVTLENHFLNDVKPLKCVLQTRLSILIAWELLRVFENRTW